MRFSSTLRRTKGFSLVELAIVLVIVALLTGGMLISLSAQQNAQAIRDTETRLVSIQDALLGFAAAKGRLPCPASTTSNGVESFAGTVGSSACTNYLDGFVPAVTLGIAPVDSQGYAIDAWGQRIRYSVTDQNSNRFVNDDGMRSAGLSALVPDLHVCSSGPANAGNCPANSDLATNAVAVIYSTGANAATGGTGTDEAENPNPNSAAAADRVFVSHPQTAAGSANGEFDDLVIWLSPNILYNRMIAAGRLP